MALPAAAQTHLELKAEELFEPSRADVVTPPEVTRFVKVARSRDTWTFTSKPADGPQRKRPTAVTGTHVRDLLPFRSCEMGLEGYDDFGNLPIGLALRPSPPRSAQTWTFAATAGLG